MLRTRDIIKEFGDRWLELFPSGRTVYIVVDAIDWSCKKEKTIPTVVSAKIDEIVLEGDEVWMLMQSEKFGFQDFRVDDVRFLKKVFLFEDEAKEALMLTV